MTKDGWQWLAAWTGIVVGAVALGDSWIWRGSVLVLAICVAVVITLRHKKPTTPPPMDYTRVF